MYTTLHSTDACVLPPATRRGPEPGCSGRNMPRAGSGAPEARARGPGSTRAGTRKIHANPTRRRAGWRSGGRCCAGRLPLRRPDALWSLSLSPPSQPSFSGSGVFSLLLGAAGCMTRPLALALRCAALVPVLLCVAPRTGDFCSCQVKAPARPAALLVLLLSGGLYAAIGRG